jgi:hypothetical protein
MPEVVRVEVRHACHSAGGGHRLVRGLPGMLHPVEPREERLVG